MLWRASASLAARRRSCLAFSVAAAIACCTLGSCEAYEREFRNRRAAVTNTRRAVPFHTQLFGIPRLIWQTSKTHSPSTLALRAARSWSELNPTWDRYVLDDSEVDAFVARWYNETVLAAFRALPLGVMRADVFRYMVVYQHGGVYTDIDTQCVQAIDKWAQPDCDVVMALENNVHMCQWTIAGVPRHPLFGKVMEHVMAQIGKPIDTTYEHFVHKATGPAVWTEAILDFLQLPDIPAVWSAREALRRDRRLCVLSWEELHEAVQHLYGSQHEGFKTDGDWSSWVQEAHATTAQAVQASQQDSLQSRSRRQLRRL